MTRKTYRVFQCDYPGCDEVYYGDPNVEDSGKGWGLTNDLKDLCPDHYQYYCDAIAEFWNPPEGQHIAKDPTEQMIEDDAMPDEDILYTNMPEMNVKVTGPTGTVEGHVEEDW